MPTVKYDFNRYEFQVIVGDTITPAGVAIALWHSSSTDSGTVTSLVGSLKFEYTRRTTEAIITVDQRTITLFFPMNMLTPIFDILRNEPPPLNIFYVTEYKHGGIGRSFLEEIGEQESTLFRMPT